MRVIDAFEDSVRTVAVSPDGRFLAVSSTYRVAVFSWLSGERIIDLESPGGRPQPAFTSDGEWMVLASHVGGINRGLVRWATSDRAKPIQLDSAYFSGGASASPDGKTFVATRAGRRQLVRLERWELPSWRAVSGFDFWSPFARLGFSPNGEFLAGIGNDSFELRIAITGGLNGCHRVHYIGDGFFTFPRDSQSVVFGWETDLHVMETRNGNVLRRVTSPGRAFADVAFLGSGRQLATVDNTPVMRVWSADSWEVVRGYDWGAGNLTCVAGTADGLAAVCGTETGKLVVFDVDE
jgi:WD40 repeat protein